MAMSKRSGGEKQEDIWIAHTELAVAPGHPFYKRLNELLEGAGFDGFVEGLCARFYHARLGRPSLMPGVYFRALLVGYFEGIDSERGIAWRVADSLALRRFLRIGLDERTPDHSTISRTRRLIDIDTHREVFSWVLGLLAERGLLKGQRMGIDATTLEANAAMRSIVRRDTGETYEEFLRGLAKASGIETPTREDLARLDRKRKKRTSNKEWKSPVDEDARIAKMKDGRTHLAHKAEHAVDMDTGAIVAVTLQAADQGDTTTLDETLCEAGEQVAEQIGREAELQPKSEPKINLNGIEELVTDKGYHSGLPRAARSARSVSCSVQGTLPHHGFACLSDGRHASYPSRHRSRIVLRRAIALWRLGCSGSFNHWCWVDCFVWQDCHRHSSRKRSGRPASCALHVCSHCMDSDLEATHAAAFCRNGDGVCVLDRHCDFGGCGHHHIGRPFGALLDPRMGRGG